MSSSFYNVEIWEEIRPIVRWKLDQVVETINVEISTDRSLAEFQGKQPVPWQLAEIMHQRANGWVQRVYDLCCHAYRNSGKVLSKDFERAIWAYCIEPFIMGEKESDIHAPAMSGFLNLLLCAVGSPPEKRSSLKVSQKQCCFDVRGRIRETWRAKLLHLPSIMDEAARAISAHNAMERRAARIVAGLPSDPPQQPLISPAPSEQRPASLPTQVTPVPTLATAPFQGEAAAEGLKSSTQRHAAHFVAGLPDTQPHPVTFPAPSEQLAATLPKQVAPPSPLATLPVPREDAAERLEGPKRDAPAGSNVASETRWEDIEILFLSDERVQIRNGSKQETRNYAEFGFDDGRSGKPNQAWDTLRALAKAGGVIRDGAALNQTWPKVEKRVQEIRKILRDSFHISADPIPFVEGVGYQACFRIGCRPSFDT